MSLIRTKIYRIMIQPLKKQGVLIRPVFKYLGNIIVT